MRASERETERDRERENSWTRTRFMFDQALKDLYEETGEHPANFFLFYMGEVRPQTTFFN